MHCDSNRVLSSTSAVMISCRQHVSAGRKAPRLAETAGGCTEPPATAPQNWSKRLITLPGVFDLARAVRCHLTPCCNSSGRWVRLPSHRCAARLTAFYLITMLGVLRQYFVSASYTIGLRVQVEAAVACKQLHLKAAGSWSLDGKRCTHCRTDFDSELYHCRCFCKVTNQCRAHYLTQSLL
jgi:hypothetical protein